MLERLVLIAVVSSYDVRVSDWELCYIVELGKFGLWGISLVLVLWNRLYCFGKIGRVVFLCFGVNDKD